MLNLKDKILGIDVNIASGEGSYSEKSGRTPAMKDFVKTENVWMVSFVEKSGKSVTAKFYDEISGWTHDVKGLGFKRVPEHSKICGELYDAEGKKVFDVSRSFANGDFATRLNDLKKSVASENKPENAAVVKIMDKAIGKLGGYFGNQGKQKTGTRSPVWQNLKKHMQSFKE